MRRLPEGTAGAGIREYRQTFFKPYRVIYRVMGKQAFIYLIEDAICRTCWHGVFSAHRYRASNCLTANLAGKRPLHIGRLPLRVVRGLPMQGGHDVWRRARRAGR